MLRAVMSLHRRLEGGQRYLTVLVCNCDRARLIRAV